MSVREPSDYFAEFAERLAGLGIEAALIGALAASRYRAKPRFTTDVDFLARSLDGLVADLEASGYDVRTMAEPGSEPYVVFARGLGQQIDILKAETPFQQEALDRAVDGVITVEDVIVHKLIAWRPRDQDDVASILDAGHDLDAAYIERWAQAWEVLDRWDQATRRAGGPPAAGH